jgi:hypothetical protein
MSLFYEKKMADPLISSSHKQEDQQHHALDTPRMRHGHDSNMEPDYTKATTKLNPICLEGPHATLQSPHRTIAPPKREGERAELDLEANLNGGVGEPGEGSRESATSLFPR